MKIKELDLNFRFCRSVRNLVKEVFDGEQRQGVCETILLQIRDLDHWPGGETSEFFMPVKQCFKTIKKFGADSAEFADAVSELDTVNQHYSRENKKDLQIAYLLRCLEMCWPMLAANNRSRKLKPSDPMTLSGQIQIAVDSGELPPNIVGMLAKHILDMEKLVHKIHIGVVPRKLLQRIRKRRKAIKFLLDTKR